MHCISTFHIFSFVFFVLLCAKFKMILHLPFLDFSIIFVNFCMLCMVVTNKNLRLSNIDDKPTNHLNSVALG